MPKPQEETTPKEVVSLTVKANRVFTLQLPKGFVLSDEPDAEPEETPFRMEQATALEDGTAGVVVHLRTTPATLHWWPKETKEGLTARLFEVAQFREAVRVKTLTVVKKTS